MVNIRHTHNDESHVVSVNFDHECEIFLENKPKLLYHTKFACTPSDFHLHTSNTCITHQ